MYVQITHVPTGRFFQCREVPTNRDPDNDDAETFTFEQYAETYDKVMTAVENDQIASLTLKQADGAQIIIPRRILADCVCVVFPGEL